MRGNLHCRICKARMPTRAGRCDGCKALVRKLATMTGSHDKDDPLDTGRAARLAEYVRRAEWGLPLFD